MNKIKLICELGINCNGSVDIAKELIGVAIDHDIDYVKFQKRDILSCYSKEELDKPRESPWGTTTREQKMGLEFGEQEYDEIDDYCKGFDIPWFSSVWDLKSVDFLKKYNTPYIKIPSAHVTHHELLRYVKEQNKPVIMSTGMSTKEEVDKALETLGDCCEVIMHTTSSYPTPLSHMNLLKIKTLKDEYGDKYKIGFSNHHQGTYFLTIAPVLGAEFLEFHITLDRAMYGSDQAASIEPNGVRVIANHVGDLNAALGTGGWIVYESEVPVIKKLRKWTE